MKLSQKGLAWALGLGWGGAMLVIGVGNLIFPPYGQSFLQAIASVYPGYHASPSVFAVTVGTLYGAVDGAIGGFILAWLYNRFASA